MSWRVTTAPWRPAAPRRRRGARRKLARSLPRREVERNCRWMTVNERRTRTIRCIEFEFVLIDWCYAGRGSRRRPCRRCCCQLFHGQAVARLFSFYCCNYVIRLGACFTAMTTLQGFLVCSCKKICAVVNRNLCSCKNAVFLCPKNKSRIFSNANNTMSPSSSTTVTVSHTVRHRYNVGFKYLFPTNVLLLCLHD